MKKIYLNPEIEVIQIQMQQMLASSTIEIDPEPITEPTDIGGREFDLEDEEFYMDEEEF